MELATKQYRVSVTGGQCRKCEHYKRPVCGLTGTYTWEKGFCEDYEWKKREEDEGESSETGSSGS